MEDNKKVVKTTFVERKLAAANKIQDEGKKRKNIERLMRKNGGR